MTLKVIGAGFGRTGTLSLKLALEQLGFGPCYHMIEVFHANAFRDWTGAWRGDPTDWDKVFHGFVSAVDFPVCSFYHELAAHYPQAKVILTERDPQSWYDSARSTIFNPETQARVAGTPEVAEMMECLFRIGLGVSVDDREALIGVYNRHNDEVKRTIPRDRLLVYSVSQGWGPLCRFLDVPAPSAAFPKLNTREDFGKLASEVATELGAGIKQ